MWRISCVGLLVLGLPLMASAQTAPPAPPASSAPAANPYTATVPVAGTSDAQRSAAIAAALTQVLQQTSPGFVPDAGTLAKASGYVRNYHYQRAAAGAGLQLQVEFDPRAVGRLVAQGGTPGSAGAAAATPTATPTTAAAPAATAATTTASAVTPTSGTAQPSPATASVPAAATSGTGMVWVAGIDNANAYASVLALLRGDSGLTQVLPVGASNGGLLLQVTYNQPLAGALAALETPNGHLAAAAQPHAGADASLQWTP